MDDYEKLRKDLKESTAWERWKALTPGARFMIGGSVVIFLFLVVGSCMG